jgi:isochorismate synthase
VTHGPGVAAARLGPSFDLLGAYDGALGHLFERRGIGVGGGPPAIVLDAASPSEVLEALRDLRVAGTVSPVAVGALPFDPAGPAPVAVAARAAVRLEEDVTWRVRAGDEREPAAFERIVGRPPHGAFDAPQLRPTPPPDRYAEAVAAAVRRIRTGALRKVVLARTIDVAAGRRLDPRQLALRLRAVDPDAYTFAVPTDDGVLVGASPELLLSRRGREVRSNPLAGSAPRSGDPEEDRELARRLEASSKDREEHAIVVDAVAEALAPRCEELRWDPEPVLLETANVWHLSTRFHGVLRDPPPSSLELVRALHPTPAVGGDPAPEALATIRELEPFPRGRYAGPVGWIDAAGDGDWAIALRCAELRGDAATLYAGAGIVADSDPQAEVGETERKFRAFLDALRWG